MEPKHGFECNLETQGYRDVINLPPRSTTTIRIPFVNPFITGIFVYHCHILAHEDRGMMQNLKVINPKTFRETRGLKETSINSWKLLASPLPRLPSQGDS